MVFAVTQGETTFTVSRTGRWRWAGVGPAVPR
jgi:hypothetical protein